MTPHDGACIVFKVLPMHVQLQRDGQGAGTASIVVWLLGLSHLNLAAWLHEGDCIGLLAAFEPGMGETSLV
eukprot:192491-Chlamydomonas_euryale.AAC.5